jgi:hypothetical protein
MEWTKYDVGTRDGKMHENPTPPQLGTIYSGQDCKYGN